ncbi:MAG: hypothetical protein BMS9Abin28_1111 [Anaerolineae bacterium]|nr:MAG: hypothetical protein BMS9Abin28_1111 [Anaerolineae bacterium]
MLAFTEPEIMGIRMEEWEYCLLWASPRKTVVVKPGGQVETFSIHSCNQGVLAGLQVDGWQTVAFNTEPTVDMTYLFKRPIQRKTSIARDKPLMDVAGYSPALKQAEISPH